MEHADLCAGQDRKNSSKTVLDGEVHPISCRFPLVLFFRRAAAARPDVCQGQTSPTVGKNDAIHESVRFWSAGGPPCSDGGENVVITGRQLLTPIADVAGVIGSIAIAPLAAALARLGPIRLPLTYRLWDSFGVTPIRYHYYQPIPRLDELPEITWACDGLTGIDFRIDSQLSLLSKLNSQRELSALPIDGPDDSSRFFYNNTTFGSGDAEIYYSVIRHFRPKRIIEIGGGYSTLVAHHAVKANGNGGEHICIEPFEMPWLEKVGLTNVIRSKVEDLPIELFGNLQENDILFIDSSHVLRPGGDVWFEYLRIMPILKSGVLVHIHDVFLPYQYPKAWLTIQRLYWNEQYLLQAILQNSKSFEVVLALHFLSKQYHDQLARACPIYGAQPGRAPGSFWMRRR